MYGQWPLTCFAVWPVATDYTVVLSDVWPVAANYTVVLSLMYGPWYCMSEGQSLFPIFLALVCVRECAVP